MDSVLFCFVLLRSVRIVPCRWTSVQGIYVGRILFHLPLRYCALKGISKYILIKTVASPYTCGSPCVYTVIVEGPSRKRKLKTDAFA